MGHRHGRAIATPGDAATAVIPADAATPGDTVTLGESSARVTLTLVAPAGWHAQERVKGASAAPVPERQRASRLIPRLLLLMLLPEATPAVPSRGYPRYASPSLQAHGPGTLAGLNRTRCLREMPWPPRSHRDATLCCIEASAFLM
ncbi:unnamed protein product [Coccothraustes coccothraustes]